MRLLFPQFYRWLSERYPLINQIISGTTLLPPFDHLYLDMNGIIHHCSHPEGMDVLRGMQERDVMNGIMRYINRIVEIARPQVSEHSNNPPPPPCSHRKRTVNRFNYKHD